MTRFRASNNTVKTATPLIFLTRRGQYQTFSTSYSAVIFNTIRVKTSHFKFEEGETKIILNTNSSGIYKIQFEGTFVETSASDGCRTIMYKNGAVISDSISENKSNNGSYGTYGANMYYIYLEKGDYIEIYVKGIGGGVHLLADTGRVAIEYMPMQGWDNSSAGRIEYKGGVSR